MGNTFTTANSKTTVKKNVDGGFRTRHHAEMPSVGCTGPEFTPHINNAKIPVSPN
jgi:hypothetical protein